MAPRDVSDEPDIDADTSAHEAERESKRRPMMWPEPWTDNYLYHDEFGQTWRLKPTGDESSPFIIVKEK